MEFSFNVRSVHDHTHLSLPLEIERRWIIDKVPDAVSKAPRIQVQQGYLTPLGAETEIRVRVEAGEYFLTVKSSGSLVRGELPIPISREYFERLWPLTDGARVAKERAYIKEQGRILDIDFYISRPDLVTVEIEFSSAAEALAFTPLEWFGREVTGIAEYKNRALAC